MTTEHRSFTITRIVAAAPGSVFRAFAEEELKREWFVPEGSGGRAGYRLDFRVGGGESGRFEIAEGPGAGTHENATTYLDIVDGERIAWAYTMAWDGRIHSASLAVVEFAPSEAGCRLSYTEQAAFVPPSDGAEMRRGGVEAQLDALTARFG